MTKNNTQKKEYLQRYRAALKKLRRLEEDAETYRISKMSPSIIYDDMPHGTDQKDLSDYIVIMEKKIKKINKQRIECIKCIDDIVDRIEALPTEDERDVLTYRYIRLDDRLRYRPWEQICCDMGYEWSSVHRIHAKALRELEIK